MNFTSSKRIVKTFPFFTIFCFGMLTLRMYVTKHEELQFPIKMTFDEQSNHVVNEMKKNKMVARSFNFENKNDVLNNETIMNNENDFSRQFIKGIPEELLEILFRMYSEVMEWDKSGNETITYRKKMGPCKQGFYRLPTMSSCRKMITCEDIDDRLTYDEVIATGTAKQVLMGKVDKQIVAISRTNPTAKMKYVARADDGINNLVKLQHPPYVVQLVGHCLGRNNVSVMVTEGCIKYTSLRVTVGKKEFYDLSTRTRFRMAIQIVASIDYLHRVNENPMVHCDLHEPKQALGQFLLTDEGQVVLNDLDEVPEVTDDKPFPCRQESGSKMRAPEFFPPEGRFTYEDYLKKQKAKPVTEKSDIWKLPVLTSILMVSPRRSLNTEETKILNSLKSIHEQCQQFEPKMRPNSLQVLTTYLNVYKTFYE